MGRHEKSRYDNEGTKQEKPGIRTNVSCSGLDEEEGQSQLDTPDHGNRDVFFNDLKDIGESEEEEDPPKDQSGSGDLASRHSRSDRDDGNRLHRLHRDRVPVIIPCYDEPDTQKKENRTDPKGSGCGKGEREGEDGTKIAETPGKFTDTKPEWRPGFLGHTFRILGKMFILPGSRYRSVPLREHAVYYRAHGHL